MITEKDIAALHDPKQLTLFRARRLEPFGLTDGVTYTPLGAAVASAPAVDNWPISDVHVIALLKNAIEQPEDPHRHFGSPMGIGGPKGHQTLAKRCQLLTTDGDPTAIGRDLYDRFRIASLPEGRANYWRLSTALTTVLRLLKEGK